MERPPSVPPLLGSPALCPHATWNVQRGDSPRYCCRGCRVWVLETAGGGWRIATLSHVGVVSVGRAERDRILRALHAYLDGQGIPRDDPRLRRPPLPASNVGR